MVKQILVLVWSAMGNLWWLEQTGAAAEIDQKASRIQNSRRSVWGVMNNLEQTGVADS